MSALAPHPLATTAPVEPTSDLDRDIAAHLARKQAAALPSKAGDPPASPVGLPDVQASIDTVQRARAEVDAILSRNQILEAYVGEVEGKARFDIKEARETADRWKARAKDAEALVRELKQAASHWETRATLAEHELQRGKQALLKLHETIAAAFGYGSALQERLRAADPNVPGLGVLQDRVSQLSAEIDASAGDTIATPLHEAA